MEVSTLITPDWQRMSTADGTVASGYNGLAANEYGWWNVVNGKVVF